NGNHKVIIVGLDNAGKTTILYQFLMNEVVHTSPTIGSNVEEIVVKNTHFLMWDIGGQESLRSSWNTYYSNTEVRNTSFTFPSSVFFSVLFLSVAAGVFVLSTGSRRGRPSHRSPFHKAACLKSKAGVSLCHVFGEGSRRGRIRQSRHRQMCGGFYRTLFTEACEFIFPDTTSAPNFFILVSVVAILCRFYDLL
uniref:ADP-ribosylation factor-like 5C n=1 Tax=Seriola lalandi dorsalis TaxID=1841481 RepID=A0A3B4WKY1_SERLL